MQDRIVIATTKRNMRTRWNYVLIVKDINMNDVLRGVLDCC